MTVTDQTARATGRRVTPTARLLLSSTASREEWLAVRRTGLGSSDVPIVMGVADRGSRAGVYYDKVGLLELERDAGEWALWGNVFEEPIAREWARRTRSVVRRVGIVAHVDEPWMLTSLDRRVTECPLNREQREVCALEVKMRDAHKSSEWSAGIPDSVKAQVLWQLAVTGLDHIHVMVVIGGNDGRRFTVRREGHEQLIANIIAACRRFWFEHVVAQQPPAVTGGERADDMVGLFQELHPNREGLVSLDAAALDVECDLRDYEEARIAESAAKKLKEAAKVKLLERLRGAEAALLDGHEAYSYSHSGGKRNVDLERLADEFPDAYEACVTRPGQWRLSIGKQYRIKGD